ncbi:MAG: ornithine carbamoyltransferase [Nanoarchaeota archaeon]
MKNLLSVSDLNKKQILELINLANKIKKNPLQYNTKLKNKNIILLFQKPSTRTRVSFEVGVNQLGGNAIVLNWNELQLGRGETVEDTTRVFERYADMIVARVFLHNDLIKMSKISKIPVVNALSDLEHPCQILSDLFTIYEHFHNFNNLKLAYIGDGNNVCNSLILGCAITGINISVATPKDYEPNQTIVKKANKIAKSKIILTNDVNGAVKNANILYTDVWVSMHQENEKKERLKIFRKYQINKKLLQNANKNAVVMHCLPAHRGLEITNDVMDSKQNIIFEQAENRLHLQKALMLKLLNKI